MTVQRPSGRSSPYPRRILAGLFWLFASLAIMVASVTFWAHQTLLTSSGWGGVVAEVAADPEVVASTSDVIAERLFERLDIEGRLETVLPGELGIVAPFITTNVEERVSGAIADFAARPGVQDAFVAVNEAAHDAAMRVIRGGDSEALTSVEGTISLDVFPLIEGALVGLQEAGFIDPARAIPDLSSYEPPAERVAQLESLLGRELPDDIGTITLVESDRLARVQDAVRAFDLITIGLIVLAALCVVLALWLSARRLRMLLLLAVGTIAALALGRGFTRLIVEDITGSLRDGPAGETVRAVVEASVDSLMLFTFAVIAIGLVAAGVALWAESQARRTADPSSQPRDARAWLREHVRTIGWAGLAVIGIVVLWEVAGPDLALLALAAAGVWLIAVRLLSGEPETPAGGVEAEGVEAAPIEAPSGTGSA